MPVRLRKEPSKGEQRPPASLLREAAGGSADGLRGGGASAILAPGATAPEGTAARARELAAASGPAASTLLFRQAPKKFLRSPSISACVGLRRTSIEDAVCGADVCIDASVDGGSRMSLLRKCVSIARAELEAAVLEPSPPPPHCDPSSLTASCLRPKSPQGESQELIGGDVGAPWALLYAATASKSLNVDLEEVARLRLWNSDPPSHASEEAALSWRDRLAVAPSCRPPPQASDRPAVRAVSLALLVLALKKLLRPIDGDLDDRQLAPVEPVPALGAREPQFGALGVPGRSQDASASASVSSGARGTNCFPSWEAGTSPASAYPSDDLASSAEDAPPAAKDDAAPSWHDISSVDPDP